LLQASFLTTKHLKDKLYATWNWIAQHMTFLTDTYKKVFYRLRLQKILNRWNTQGFPQGGYMLNPGLDALWKDERKRREINNLPNDIEPIDSQGIFNTISLLA
jgi:hypothetical protein